MSCISFDFNLILLNILAYKFIKSFKIKLYQQISQNRVNLGFIDWISAGIYV